MKVSQIYDGDNDPVEMKIEIKKNEAANWGGLSVWSVFDG